MSSRIRVSNKTRSTYCAAIFPIAVMIKETQGGRKFFCSEFKGVVQQGSRTVRGTTPLNSEQLTRESVKGNEKRGTLATVELGNS